MHESELVKGTNSYLNLTLNMPVNDKESRDDTTDGTKVDLVDGTENEYSIKNAYLLLFQGSSQNVDEALFCGGFIIWETTPDGDNKPHISKKYKTKLILNDFSKADDTYYFGLILANTNGFGAMREFFTYYDESGVQQIKWISDDVTFAQFKALKIKTLASSGQNTKLSDANNYVLMTNAILFSKAGGETGNTFSTLVNCTDYISQEESGSNTVNFYLERVAAKVQVSLETGFSRTGSLSNVKLVDGDTQSNINYIIDGWCLANVSPTTYLLRDWNSDWNTLRASSFSEADGASKYRFIGSTPIPEANAYRGYYCQSTNFGTNEWSQSSYFVQPWISDFGTVQYCNENTFSVAHMMVKNATHVIVRVKFGSGADLYMLNDEKSKLHTSTNLTDEQKSAGVKYTGGYAYYILPIWHFGDDFTPWSENQENVRPIEDTETEENNINASYPVGANRDANYLGRWGVVRNCWYSLSINGISAVGINQDPTQEASVITEDPTPLDNFRTTMECNLKIKDWIIRSQTETM